MNTKELFENLGLVINPHYLKRYLRLISTPESNLPEYTEKHHILPKSLFPKYSRIKTNLLTVSARKHFILHWVLCKMLPGCESMAHAAWIMKNIKGSKFTSKLFAELRQRRSKAMSGSNNPMHGLGAAHPASSYRHTEERKQKIREALAKNHWNRGRKLDISYRDTGTITMFNRYKEMWLLAPKLLQIWKNTGQPGARNLAKAAGIEKCSLDMVRKFKRGWDPLTDKNWLAFSASNKQASE